MKWIKDGHFLNFEINICYIFISPIQDGLFDVH